MIRLGKMGTKLLHVGWKNPYITDGLVAMWDGEWNAGPGNHSASLVATNLAGEAVISTPSTDYWQMSAQSFYMIDSYPTAVFELTQGLFDLSSFTIEICAERSSDSDSNGEFGFIGGGVTIDWRDATRAVFRLMKDGGGYSVNDGLTVGDMSIPRRMAMSFNSSTGICNCYINGVNVLSRNATPSKFNSSSGVRIGPLYLSAKGAIYNLAIYSRVLTAAEIAANYAIDKERFNLP